MTTMNNEELVRMFFEKGPSGGDIATAVNAPHALSAITFKKMLIMIRE